MPLTSIAALLPPEPTPFELGVLCEVFGVDRSSDGVPRFDLRVCSERPGSPVPMSVGLSVIAPYGYEAADDADVVAVAAVSSRAYPPTVLEAIRRAHARGATLLSVCSGVFVLAAAGVLQGRKCACHWFHADEMRRRHPDIEVDATVLFVDDGNIITSAGTAAGIDACLHLVRRELGAEVATRIARRMVVPPQRDGGQQQFIDRPIAPTSESSLAPLLSWMSANLAHEQPVRELARRVALSERTFARRFVAETGTTPAQWLISQRVDLARRLLEQTTLGVDSIAERSGFGSGSVLRHHFGRLVGVAPADYRKSFATPTRARQVG